MQTEVILILALGSLAFATLSLFGRRPMRCLLHMLAGFFCLSGIFLLLGFPYLAAIQLLIQGAVVLGLCAHRLRRDPEQGPIPEPEDLASHLGPLLAATLAALLVLVVPEQAIATQDLPRPVQGTTAAEGGRGLGEALLGRHLLAFQAVILLLLAALLSLLVLTRRGPDPGEDAGEGVEA